MVLSAQMYFRCLLYVNLSTQSARVIEACGSTPVPLYCIFSPLRVSVISRSAEYHGFGQIHPPVGKEDDSCELRSHCF
jgi:hypothetical protein